ncbi:site-2 protease family protein [Oligoflexia bacterium]|nr:site-2 protease family protein [Oligoflexia bacterium]
MQTSKAQGWSVNLCNINGIPIRVHASFLLLIAWVALEASETGSGAISEVTFVLAIFGCVLLHELGHTLAAQFFGIKTSDIVLYPFGGIATIESTPEPKPEFVIAIAGPLVNIMLAILLFTVTDFHFTPEQLASEEGSPLSFTARLFFANLILAIFNLLPALPMDGGRILRALLALMHVKNATIIAARLSQVLSLLLGAFALYIGDTVLFVIAVFVFISAFQEHYRAKSLSIAKAYTVKDVMTEAKDLQLLGHGMTVTQAIEVASKTSQNFFPVLHGPEAIGVVNQNNLMVSAASADERYISEVMDRNFPTTVPEEKLEDIVKRIHAGTRPPFVVNENDLFVGMILEELLIEFLFLSKAKDSTKLSKEVPA